MLTSERKKPKRSKIRYAEYYDLQKTLDSLYADSLKGKVFVHLMELISSEENIRMAYRTIKGNTGSSTAGVDKRTIQDLAKLNEEKYLIRRLTPLECERLQGFPDGWTDIPDASDSARYKALGNSVAIPCVEFIMGRIAAALRAV